MTGLPLDVVMLFESEPLLWTVNNVYSESKCQQLIKLIEKSSPQPPTINTSFPIKTEL